MFKISFKEGSQNLKNSMQVYTWMEFTTNFNEVGNVLHSGFRSFSNWFDVPWVVFHASMVWPLSDHSSMHRRWASCVDLQPCVSLTLLMLCNGNDLFGQEMATDVYKVVDMYFIQLFFLQQGIIFHGISLRSVQPGTFCGLRSLEELNLSNNKLTNAPELLPVKPTLQRLKLGKNKIQHFCSDYFTGFEVLQKVNIGHNLLYSVPNMGHVGNSLRVLEMSLNKIKTLDENLTGGLDMTALNMLQARGNEIHYISVAIFAQMPKLNFLSLGENQLRHFADSTAYLQAIPGWPMELILTLNPLTCDKALSWLLVLVEKDIIVNRVGNQVECHEPPCLKGRDVMSLSKCFNTLICCGHCFNKNYSFCNSRAVFNVIWWLSQFIEFL